MAEDRTAATVVPEAVWMPSSRRAFRAWCVQQELTPDFDAPHGQAFVAGYEAGGEDEYQAASRGGGMTAAQGRDEAAAIYAALRRSGAGFPAFWKAMEKAKAKVEEAARSV